MARQPDPGSTGYPSDVWNGRENRYSFLYDCLRGEISLAKKSGKEAINIWENITVLDIPRVTTTDADLISYNVPFLKDGLARAYQKNGDFDKAIAAYERLITFDPHSQDCRLINPLYYYRLGNLYEQKSMIDKAKSNYEKFLAFWKNADPGRPEVEDAKKRLSGLN